MAVLHSVSCTKLEPGGPKILPHLSQQLMVKPRRNGQNTSILMSHCLCWIVSEWIHAQYLTMANHSHFHMQGCFSTYTWYKKGKHSFCFCRHLDISSLIVQPSTSPTVLRLWLLLPPRESLILEFYAWREREPQRIHWCRLVWVGRICCKDRRGHWDWVIDPWLSLGRSHGPMWANLGNPSGPALEAHKVEQ